MKFCVGGTNINDCINFFISTIILFLENIRPKKNGEIKGLCRFVTSAIYILLKKLTFSTFLSFIFGKITN